MEPITVRVDRQALSLLDITKWSNLACALLLAGLNVVGLFRSSGAEEAAQNPALSPDLLLLLSVFIGGWMILRAVQAVAVKRRLDRVTLTVSDDGVEGVSLPAPTARDGDFPDGEHFSVPFSAIEGASVVEVAITKNHKAPSLRLECGEAVYIVPAPERLKELLELINRHTGATGAQVRN